MCHKKRVILVASAVACLTGVAVADAPKYSVVELEMFPGSPGAVALDVNEAGDVVGLCTDINYDGHAVLWINGVIHDLGPGIASSINSSRTVIGNHYAQAFIWDPQNGRQNLTLGYDEVSALKINDAGVVAGAVRNYEPYAHWAFRYDGVTLELCAPPQATDSEATALNNMGHVAGNWWGVDQQAAFIHRDGGTTDLGRLTPDWDWAQVIAINDADVMVGEVQRSNPAWVYRAYKFDVNANVFTELPGTMSEANTVARDINLAGQIVGHTDLGTGLLWDSSGELFVLNDLISPSLGWNLLDAAAISENGLICGRGDRNGKTRGYLLIPGACPGDIVSDWQIDLLDLAKLLSAFSSCTGDPSFLVDADFDNDGCVGLSDLTALLAVFGERCE